MVKLSIETNFRGLVACLHSKFFSESWDSQLHLMEFAYNNNYQAINGMTPFEALYGKSCRTPVCWEEVGKRKLLGPELV